MSLTVLLLAACSTTGGSTSGTGSSPTATVPVVTSVPQTPTPGSLPAQPLDVAQLRAAYGVDTLISQGITGKGQTVVDIVSFGSPIATLTSDLAAFSQQNNLPTANIQELYPVGAVNFDPSNQDMAGWQGETTLDVEIIHAIAPDANIVVLASPVSETEGTAGLPEFRQMVQYNADHHLGNIVSQSWGASEVSLKNDPKGSSEVAKWDALFKQTTQQGITYFASSGDEDATDYTDVQNDISPTRTIGFPADDPWVTSVGGTSLYTDGTLYRETTWNEGRSGSNGGFSTFFGEPTYQQGVAKSSPNPFNNQRGVPDVAANADPATGLSIIINGNQISAGGTSASAPLWAGIMALADQKAGKGLGFINKALYQLATSTHYANDFHDVTVGDNNFSNGALSVQGFPAGTGWDPVTGLGSPNAQFLVPDLTATLGG